MHVLFLTAFETDNIGVRSLVAFLHSFNISAHIVQLEMKLVEELDVDSADMDDKNLCYSYSAGGSPRSRSIVGRSVTNTEKQLLRKAVEEQNPDIIGFSSTTPYKSIFADLIPVLRQAAPRAFLIGGGTGPTLEPEFFLRHGADAVARGEGEEVLLELTQTLASGPTWRNLCNISYLHEGRLVNNRLRPLIADLDTLPQPVVPSEHYSCIINGELRPGPLSAAPAPDSRTDDRMVYNIIASRGCIGQCSYCNTVTIHRQYSREHPGSPRVRERNLQSVMKELVLAKNTGAATVVFGDDWFIRDTETLIGFFEEYNQKIALPFVANFHPRQLRDEKLLSTLARGGLKQANFGVQSGDPDFCKRVYNRPMASDDYPGLCEQLSAYAIDVNLQFIEGNPLAGEDVFDNTLKFVSKLPFDPSEKTRLNPIVYLLRHIPQSPLIEEFPQIEDHERSLKEWIYKSALIHLRRITNDDEFSQIRADPFYRERPEELGAFYKKTLRNAYRKYLTREQDRLRGKDVYFWGCGELYHMHKHLFAETRPRAILVDIPGSADEVDGVRVHHPSEVLHDGTVLPILVFSSGYKDIYRKIRKHYPAFTDIVICRKT